MLSRDIQRVGSVMKDGIGGHRMAEGKRGGVVGSVFGPPGAVTHYDYACKRWEPGPQGECTVIEIHRSGPGVEKAKLSRHQSVGNIFGLGKQLSRDIVKLWGCAPDAERGFEGSRRRRRRR